MNWRCSFLRGVAKRSIPLQVLRALPLTEYDFRPEPPGRRSSPVPRDGRSGVMWHSVRMAAEPQDARSSSPFQEFFRTEAAGGALLVACACGALIVANSGSADSYHGLLATTIAITGGGHGLSLTVHQWINERAIEVARESPGVTTPGSSVEVREWQGPEAGLALLQALAPPAWLAGSYLWDAV